MDRPAILIRDIDDARCAARAAAALGRPVALLSERDAALTAGVGWFDAVMRAARRTAPEADLAGILDCGDRADHVQFAWRQGIEAAIYRGPARVAERLADIAARMHCRLLRRRPRALEVPAGYDCDALAARLRRTGPAG